MKNIENLTTPTRERTSVPISGLDLSTPDDLVQDGKCETLHNMRYEAEAWRPVHKHLRKDVAFSAGGPIYGSNFTILYRHPTDSEDVYIARRTLKQGNVDTKYIICRYDTSDNTSDNPFTDIGTFSALPKISHFGNVLIITEGVTPKYYLYKDGKYEYFSRQMPLPFQIQTTRAESYHNIFDDESDVYFILNQKSNTYAQRYFYPIGSIQQLIANVVGGSEPSSEYEITQYVRLGNVENNPTSPMPTFKSVEGKDLMLGNLCYVIAYKGPDGNILQVSPLNIITRTSELLPNTKFMVGSLSEFGGVDSKIVTGSKGTDISLWMVTSYTIKKSKTVDENFAIINDTPNDPFVYEDATISFNIPKGTYDSDLFHSVAIYCSLPTQVYQLQKINELYINPKELSPNEAYNTNELFNQPLYLLTEILKDDIPTNNGSPTTINIMLTKDKLTSLAGKEVYTPVNLAPISAETLYDYNSRLHLANVSIDYLAYPHINVLNDGGQIDDQKTQRLGVAVEVNGVTQYIMPESFKTLYTIKNKYVISIPDTSIKAFLSNLINLPIAVYPFRYAYGNGFAYYTRPATAQHQFPELGDLTDDGTVTSSNAVQTYVSHTNRLQVSETNNCFSLPYDLSYRIGSESNRIIALQSAAMEMSDAKFGEFPLYAFTTEGIFALQSGATTLYSNIIPINYDVIINPSTIAINGAIMYITERGVHILSNQGSQVISTPIHKANGMPDIEFLKDAVFIHPKQRNEVLLHNSTQKKTYVYNLDAGYWSTRDMTGIKINTDELVDKDNKCIYDLNDENENAEGLIATIVTRPVKLGNVEYKRLETIIPRMNTGSSNCLCDINVDASQDGNSYGNLIAYDETELSSNVNNPLVFRRVPYSAKYYKFGINLYHLLGEDSFDPSITHIDFEWYRRFSRRMR